MQYSSSKIIVVGEGNVGKTTMIMRARINEANNEYIPTMGVEVYPIRIRDHTLKLWDCAGQGRYMGLGDGYYIQAKGAIIVANRDTLHTIPLWINNVKRVVPDIRIVICLIRDNDEYEYNNNKIYTIYADLNSQISCLNIFEVMANMIFNLQHY